MRVQPLEIDKALELLKTLAKDKAADDASLRAICELTGCLPLAVHIAGRYLAESVDTASDYLDWLKTMTLEALDQGKRKNESDNV
ncbi:hypothetical protein MCHI_001622, partial [Candidatus Magnetoovum chiemensis]